MSYHVNGSSALRRYKHEEQRFNNQKEKVLVKHTIKTREKMLYLLIVLSCVAIACAIIARYSQIAEYNFQVQTMKHQIESMSEENNYLRLQIAEKSSPERILSAAQKMGMIRSEENIIATYGKSKSSTSQAKIASIDNEG